MSTGSRDASDATLRRLEYDHQELDLLMDALAVALQAPPGALQHRVLKAATDRLLRVLPEHMAFEEQAIYAPLSASGQARDPLVATLIEEHADLRETLAHLRRCRAPEGQSECDHCRTFLEHLLDTFHAHEPREHRYLFPLLEQLPPRMIPKDVTVNALIRAHPELADVLTAFGVDAQWDGCATLEEAAWYRGVSVDGLLAALAKGLHLTDAALSNR